jgi:hypothetical protein
MRMLTDDHLGEAALIDLLDGVADAPARAHAASCLHCRGRLEQATAGLDLAREADVPEPSPLFWESFRHQVGRRIEAGDPPPAWRRFAALPWLAAAAALVAVAVLVPRGPGPAPASPAASVLPAWSALPPAEEDPGLEMLAAVLPGNTGLGPLAECQGLGDCLAEASALSEEESMALTEALQRELGEQS